VRAFHPASPFVSLLEKAKPRAFLIKKELVENYEIMRKLVKGKVSRFKTKCQNL
jgi:hypothetical protein